MRLLATTVILAAALSSLACNRKDDDKLSDDEVAAADGRREESPTADTRCTSPSVQSAMHLMFDDWTAYLADRFGGTMRPKPQLPLIPLGIDSDRFAAMADRPGARVDFRRRLAAGDSDVVVVWVGRLSFFE